MSQVWSPQPVPRVKFVNREYLEDTGSRKGLLLEMYDDDYSWNARNTWEQLQVRYGTHT